MDVEQAQGHGCVIRASTRSRGENLDEGTPVERRTQSSCKEKHVRRGGAEGDLQRDRKAKQLDQAAELQHSHATIAP